MLNRHNPRINIEATTHFQRVPNQFFSKFSLCVSLQLRRNNNKLRSYSILVFPSSINLDSQLPLVELSYNNSFHTTIGMPPYEMLYAGGVVPPPPPMLREIG
ncbi:hypothetical protein HanPI659440_Chr08g0279061 [Helianthus annuus]|nr:hypothetical protein HanPI659440_Chr08g0279061 [Helianthus annuus]